MKLKIFKKKHTQQHHNELQAIRVVDDGRSEEWDDFEFYDNYRLQSPVTRPMATLTSISEHMEESHDEPQEPQQKTSRPQLSIDTDSIAHTRSFDQKRDKYNSMVSAFTATSTNKLHQAPFLSIGLQVVASPTSPEFAASATIPSITAAVDAVAAESSDNANTSTSTSTNSKRDSHRFSSINPNYKIKRLPVETIEDLSQTFHEYFGEESLQYKSLDPTSAAAYLIEPRKNFEQAKPAAGYVKSPIQSFTVSFGANAIDNVVQNA